MAFSAKELKQPSTHMVPGKSYAAVANKRISTSPQSLMHAENNCPGTPTNNPYDSPAIKTVKTRIWRHARSPNAYFLDISKIPNVTDHQHLGIDTQYKARNFYGVKFLGKAIQRYIEIYPSEDIKDNFLANGVLYESDNFATRLIPCAAVDGQGEVIQVNLSDLPFLQNERLLQNITEIMSKYGRVLDFGLKLEQAYEWILGSGYAIIQQVPGTNYPKLSHTISWNSEQSDFCHATFPEMATWCRYCHEEGHTKFECTKALAHIMCYNCDCHGHKQADCDKSKRGSKMNKRRKTYETHVPQEGSSPAVPIAHTKATSTSNKTQSVSPTAGPMTHTEATSTSNRLPLDKKNDNKQPKRTTTVEDEDMQSSDESDEDYRTSSSVSSSDLDSQDDEMEQDKVQNLLQNANQQMGEQTQTSSSVDNSPAQQQPLRDHNNSPTPTNCYLL